MIDTTVWKRLIREQLLLYGIYVTNEEADTVAEEAHNAMLKVIETFALTKLAEQELPKKPEGIFRFFRFRKGRP